MSGALCHSLGYESVLLLSSKSFIVLHFTFKSMFHFELLFIRGEFSQVHFLLPMDTQLLLHLLLKDHPSFIELLLYLYQKF